MDKLIEVQKEELWARNTSDRRQPRNDRRRSSDRRDEFESFSGTASSTENNRSYSVRRMKLATAESVLPKSRKGMIIDAKI